MNTKSRHYEYMIGGVFYALMTRTAVDGSVESQLVLEALRRSGTDLAGATEAQLSDYLDGYDTDRLKGVANNIKGIYHEELWVYQYNEAHADTYAEMFGATKHAGADIQIKSFRTHEVVDEVQLKVTDSVAYVNEHLERYAFLKARYGPERVVHFYPSRPISHWKHTLLFRLTLYWTRLMPIDGLHTLSLQ